MTALPQQMQALAWANEVRIANANFKRDIAVMKPRRAAEHVAVAVECDHDHPTLGAMPVDRLLLSVPRLGRQKVNRCLVAAGVGHPGKRLRDLTPRQRDAVAAQLRLWALGYRA